MVEHRGEGSLVISQAGERPWKPLTLGLLVLVNNKPLSFQSLGAGYSVTNLSILKGIKILEQCFLSNVLNVDLLRYYLVWETLSNTLC